MVFDQQDRNHKQLLQHASLKVIHVGIIMMKFYQYKNKNNKRILNSFCSDMKVL